MRKAESNINKSDHQNTTYMKVKKKKEKQTQKTLKDAHIDKIAQILLNINVNSE